MWILAVEAPDRGYLQDRGTWTTGLPDWACFGSSRQPAASSNDIGSEGGLASLFMSASTCAGGDDGCGCVGGGQWH